MIFDLIKKILNCMITIGRRVYRTPGSMKMIPVEEEEAVQGAVAPALPEKEEKPLFFVPKFKNTAYRESGVFRTESDPFAVGAVSTGKGDYGGVSYGPYQFASKNSTQLQRFINSKDNPYGKELKKAGAPGGKKFNDAWQSIAQRDNLGFGKAQEDFFLKDHDPMIKSFAKAGGFSLEDRSPELMDLIFGTVNQYGSGLSKSIAKNSGISADMTDAEIAEKIQSYKRDNYKKHFRNSQNLWNGILARINEEEKEFSGGS